MSDDLREIADHLADVLSAVTALPTEVLALEEAAGRTLTEPVFAAVDIPVFDNSAMDGFAVLFDDVKDASPGTPVALRVIADLPAGTDLNPPVVSGEAARIMTGAPVPSAATAVVPFEDTVGGLADSLDTVTVVRAPRGSGAHIRRRGDDAVRGAEVIAAGTPLGGLQVGAIAAAGVAQVAVARRPRVAVVSTGSELVRAGAPLRRGQIPESNSILLATLVTDAGGDVVQQTTIDDIGDGPLRLIEEAEAASVDVIVFTGGVSAGAYEVVKNALGEMMTFSKVRMQPGKPQGFGATPGGTLLFGLPGNPVSAAVSFEVFVRPALLALQGRSLLARPIITVAAGAGWRTPPGRAQFLPVTIDRSDPAAWVAVPATTGGSHLAGGLGRAEAYALVDADVTSVNAGDLVDVMLLS
ncbi:gephyrin-like molybdotransferase Glp [Microbacterium sp. C7(2022)]|uniref:molybdopterin molybdotransferase MoeA n=1 Tax=Microbacterium sp. C7(2022) TaxID=2992759 RepID=UPI00237ADF41|nr:gephyrin-like molybdotransferase Glp [Microbacterium sp. C7(2022)]MDE0546068.1 molybdopterin molybdotransferase MoeA [Microbacterium sp. C7(2022)]